MHIMIHARYMQEGDGKRQENGDARVLADLHSAYVKHGDKVSVMQGDPCSSLMVESLPCSRHHG